MRFTDLRNNMDQPFIDGTLFFHRFSIYDLKILLLHTLSISLPSFHWDLMPSPNKMWRIARKQRQSLLTEDVFHLQCYITACEHYCKISESVSLACSRRTLTLSIAAQKWLLKRSLCVNSFKHRQNFAYKFRCLRALLYSNAQVIWKVWKWLWKTWRVCSLSRPLSWLSGFFRSVSWLTTVGHVK